MIRPRLALRSVTILVACGCAFALLPLSVAIEGTYEHARAVGKRCATCHDSVRPDASNLNATGRFFLVNRRLPREGEPTNAAMVAPQDDGAAIYRRTCATCHGPLGEGTTLAPALVGSLKHGDAAGQLRELVSRGVPGTTMVAFSRMLSAEQIDSVVEHILELRKKPSRP